MVGVSRPSKRPSRSLTLKRAEDQDLRANAGGAKRRPFFDVRAGHQIRTGILERASHLHGAVAVRIRLDHGDDPRRRALRAASRG